MSILKSLCIAFSMYSKIPMPSVEWSEKNIKYALCFLPFVGAVTGAVMLIWFWLCGKIGIGNICFAAAAAAIPVLINGGIHADGFIDTSDALSSYGNKEKRLEIMSDPHIGAFAVISAVLYFMLYFGFLTEIETLRNAAVLSLGFVMSRAVCSLLICVTDCAKKDGLLYKFSAASNKTATAVVSAAIFLICAYLAIRLNAIVGAAVVIGFAVSFLWHRAMVIKKFGGITGDTCGRFIQLSELATLIIIAVGGILF